MSLFSEEKNLLYREKIMELDIDADMMLHPSLYSINKKLRQILRNARNLIPNTINLLESYSNRFKEINQIVSQDLKGGVKISIKDHVVSDAMKPLQLSTTISRTWK